MTTDAVEKELAKKEKEREDYITNTFRFALEIILVFLIPAVLGVFVASRLWGGNSVWYILPVTFVFSWVIVIVRWRKMHAILTKLDADIIELKKQRRYDGNS